MIAKLLGLDSNSRHFRMDIGQIVSNYILCLSIVGMLAYFFYRSTIAFLILSPISFLIFRFRLKDYSLKKRNIIRDEFKELLRSLNGSLQAGYSLENAIIEALTEMKNYLGNKSAIVIELGVIKIGLENNQDLGILLRNMANNLEDEDIMELAGLLRVAKETGGNLRKIINAYIGVIEQKNEVRQEINTMISAKKYELRIMCIIPFLIILYIQLTSPGFFNGLYHNLVGISVMSLALLMYGVAVYMGEKIMTIEV